MSKHHFIVTFDSEAGFWFWNTDLEEGVFSDGSILVDGRWTNSSHSTDINDIDTAASDALLAMLKVVNNM